MAFHNDYNGFLSRIAKVSPVECDFSVGDTVTFTNDFGVVFNGLTVIGFAESDEFYGRFIFLDSDAWWFPHAPCELTKEQKSEIIA